MDHVDFSYVPGVPILHDVSLVAKPGQKIGLVGPTGAGKSTIINVITRYYDIQAGDIRLDDASIYDVTDDQPARGRRAWCCRSRTSSPTR